MEEHNDVEFREMTCRSVLNFVDGSRASGFFSVNPYRGCEFGCAYCYARYTHEYLDHARWEEFERLVYVKTNAAPVFARELKRKRVLEFGVSFGSATDPYQPAERRFQLTRRLLEKLLPHRGIDLTIVTKSGLVERDAPLLAELAKRHEVKVLISCITLDPVLQRSLEPRAHVPERRFQAMAALSAAGVDAGLIAAPILPGITDSDEQLRALCARAREAGASSVTSQVLFLPQASRARFFSWLEQHRPELWGRYRDSFREGLDLSRPTRERIGLRLRRAMARAGFPAQALGEVGRGESLERNRSR